MMCPKCYGPTKVNESREKVDGIVYRRRWCLECGHRFTTNEIICEDKPRKKTEGKHESRAH